MDYYDVFPRIVPADKVSEVRIRPRYKHAFFPETELMQVVCNPFDGLNPDGKYGADADAEKRVEWRMDGDTLVIRAFFTGEQEHNVRVFIRNEQGGEPVRTLGFRIYSLEPDLYELRPYRGDFHIHTTGSDGRETPCYVAARYRQKGFDFAAISDHRDYRPSVEAIDYWKALDLDFRLYPGEEVHSLDNPVHIIHFGGRYSINDRWRDNTEQYLKEVAAIQEALPDKNPRVNNFAVAASEWVFDEIRRAGGLCVFCHPYWSVAQNVIDEGITSEILKRNKFDAFEVLGGFYRYQFESNNFQVARYYEEQAKGNRFPVVGLSDSHGVDRFGFGEGRPAFRNAVGMKYADSRDGDLFGWYYTVVLAKSNTAEELIGGVRNFRSCAVSSIEGETPRVYGSFRMVKYVNFLLREYFPMHDTLCATEGALMLDHLAGDAKAADALKLLKGRTVDYMEASFGK